MQFPKDCVPPQNLWGGCSNGKDFGDIFQKDNMWFLNIKEGFAQICESPKGQMYGKDSYLPPNTCPYYYIFHKHKNPNSYLR